MWILRRVSDLEDRSWGARRGHWSVTSPQGFLTALRSEIQSAKLPPDPALRGWGPWRPGLGGAAWAQHPQPCSRGGALLSVPHVLPLLSEMRIDAGETESRTTRPLAVHTRSDSDTQNSGAALHVVLLVLPDSSGRWPPQPSADLRPLTRRRRSGSRPAPPFEVCGEWREGRWGPCQTSASHASLDEPPVSPPPNAGPARSGLSAGVGAVLPVTQTQAGAALVGASACCPTASNPVARPGAAATHTAGSRHPLESQAEGCPAAWPFWGGLGRRPCALWPAVLCRPHCRWVLTGQRLRFSMMAT